MSRSFIPLSYTLLYIVLILHSNMKSGVPNGVFFFFFSVVASHCFEIFRRNVFACVFWNAEDKYFAF
jgi:hypothetical protein